MNRAIWPSGHPPSLVGEDPADKLRRGLAVARSLRRARGGGSGHPAIWVALAALVVTGCGKEGPPLPPLHLSPSPVTEVVARRQGNEARFTFALPTRNQNGPGPISLERVEIFAATVAAGAVAPTNRELLMPVHRAGSIDVEPPPPEGGAEPEKKDPRPGPGDTVTFVEELNEARLKPTFTTPVPLPAVVDPAKPAAPAAAATDLPSAVAKRIYIIRSVARGGRSGQPSARIEIPLVDPPPPPSSVAAKFTESAVTLAWTPPAGEPTTPLASNVYVPDGGAPLNAAPLTTPAFERQGIEFGKEECFVVRTVVKIGSVEVESAPSERACVTPSDVFPPAAPKGLSAIAGSGVISLIWDASTEPDLAGYLVLRGEVPGDTLQPLTPSPIRDTTFRDTTAKPGVRYVYAIVAVDGATPPNTSAQSVRVEETAR